MNNPAPYTLRDPADSRQVPAADRLLLRELARGEKRQNVMLFVLLVLVSVCAVMLAFDKLYQRDDNALDRIAPHGISATRARLKPEDAWPTSRYSMRE